ncbi:MAG: DUF6807 family protein [Candidatus Hydrogenedentota bacterium]
MLHAILVFAALTGVFGADESASKIVFTTGTVTITDADRTVLRYRYTDVPYKPYVDVLTTPSGINVLRDSPDDHRHHHALMYAIKVNGVNYWEEHDTPGVQAHHGFTQTRILTNPGGGMFTSQLAWKPSPDSAEPVLHETRRIRSYGVVEGATLAAWHTQLTAPEPVTLGGSHYHGLGMRFVESMDQTGDFRFEGDAEGEGVRGTEKLTPGNWAAYTAPADGNTVTVAMFDHPDNPRPVLWFTMLEHFSYLSATMNLHREPMELVPEDGQPGRMAVCYGIALWNGRPEETKIQATYEAWLKQTTAAEVEAQYADTLP